MEHFWNWCTHTPTVKTIFIFLDCTAYGVDRLGTFGQMDQPGLFLFIFVLFKRKFTETSVRFSRIRTRIIGVEGEHHEPLDHHHGHGSPIRLFSSFYSVPQACSLIFQILKINKSWRIPTSFLIYFWSFQTTI